MVLGKLVLLALLALQSDGRTSNQCKCGIRQPENSSLISLKVTRGEDASPNEFPWAALLIVRVGEKDSLCGGTLINNRYVLTAAHCVPKSSKLEVLVILGEHRISVTESKELIIKAEPPFIVHDQYKGNNKLTVNDFALIRLSDQVDFNRHPHIRPICIPDYKFQDYRDEEPVIVVGWGRTEVKFERYGSFFFGNGSTPADTLQKLELRIVRQKKCFEVYNDIADYIKPFEKRIQGNNVCAASLVGDTCKGDSGGSLAMKNKNGGYYEIIGVTSYGYGCGSYYKGEPLPGVYVRVSSVTSWIDRNTSDGIYCAKPNK